MKSLIFETIDGSSYKLNELGIRVVEFEPESLDTINDVTTIPGSGYIVNRVGYNARYINAEFRLQAVDMVDYALFRAEVFDLFVKEENFYIIDEKDSTKRWFVCSDGKFSLDRALKTGNFNISFLCVNRYQESIMTANEIQTKEWDIGLFAWNGLITWNDDVPKYNFKSNLFSVNNLGNAKIQPEDWVLEIKIKANAGVYLEIKNNTNGSVFRYNKPLLSSDTLTVSGLRVRKNNVNALSDTTMTFLSLEPGINDITVTGGNVIDIDFNFRFLFK